MSKIRIVTTLSIDGFCVPQKLQELFGFNASQYENLCLDADAVLINKDEYMNLREIELDCGMPLYVIQKDCSLMSDDESRRLTIGDLESEGKKNIVIIGNKPTLIYSLLNNDQLDEISICQFPVILGKGKRIFPALLEYSLWKVKSRQLFDSCITIIHYHKQIQGGIRR